MRTGILVAALAGGVAARSLAIGTAPQHPLKPVSEVARKTLPVKQNVTEELVLAEIIPTVTDLFTPLVDLEVSWPSAAAYVGNTVDPSHLQDEPKIHLTSVAPSQYAPRPRRVYPSTDIPLKPTTEDVVYEQFVTILTDPDAKSRDNPKWAEMCHWIAYWPISSSSTGGIVSAAKKQDIMPYKPPGPPPKTWKHRYVFLVLTPLNGSTEKLTLSKPCGRQRWGNTKVRTGVRQWAAANGLGVVGANFVYAMNKKQ